MEDKTNKEYKVQAYIWISAENEEEAEEKLRNEVLVLGISGVEKI